LTESGLNGPTTRDPDLANFLNHVELIRNKFSEIDAISERIGTLSASIESSTTAKEFSRAHASFRDEIHKASAIIRTIKSQVDALEVSNKDFEGRFTEGRESEINYRKASWAAFNNRLRSSIVMFNKAQGGFESVYIKRTEASGLNRDLTSSPDSSPMGLAEKALATAFNEEDAIKRDDMKRLEKSLVEIREAFLQIATLVESQGELLDCIEFNTVNAKNYSHEAQKQLISARKKQRKALFLKAMCVLLLLCALGGLIFGIIKAVK
jgi:syntaxin 1B/2/3